jgi:hypothetical protein
MSLTYLWHEHFPGPEKTSIYKPRADSVFLPPKKGDTYEEDTYEEDAYEGDAYEGDTYA